MKPGCRQFVLRLPARRWLVTCTLNGISCFAPGFDPLPHHASLQTTSAHAPMALVPPRRIVPPTATWTAPRAMLVTTLPAVILGPAQVCYDALGLLRCCASRMITLFVRSYALLALPTPPASEAVYRAHLEGCLRCSLDCSPAHHKAHSLTHKAHSRR